MSKLTSASYILLRCRDFLPLDIQNLLFNAIGLAHINYGITVYLLGRNKALFGRLESRYIDCGRIMLYNKKGSSRSQTLTTLQWLPLKEHLTKYMLNYLYTILYNQTPLSLYNCLKMPSHTYSTRHSENNFILPSIMTKYGRMSFNFWAPFIWAIIPTEVKDCASLSSFNMSVLPILKEISNDLHSKF